MKYVVSLGEIEVNVPDDIEALLPFVAHAGLVAGRNGWVAEYERCRTNCQHLPVGRFERLIYALLSLGIEPTMALAAYREMCDAHERE